MPTDLFRDNIAKQLGVTPTGLKILARYASGHSAGGNGARKLIAQGYLQTKPHAFYECTITPEGVDLLAKARGMGW